MKHILKETIKIIAILAIAIPAFAFLAGSWNEPIQSPPGTNVDAPINVGLTAQTKEGGLWLNTLGAAVGLIVDKGNVGIGVAEPAQKLDVAGKISIGNDAIAPTAGTIRWTGIDFEGFDGSQWVSLTEGTESAPITCTSWDYSGWSSCDLNGQRTRSVTSYSPSDCTGGYPITTQACSCVTRTTTGTSGQTGGRRRQAREAGGSVSCLEGETAISGTCSSGITSAGFGLRKSLSGNTYTCTGDKYYGSLEGGNVMNITIKCCR